MLASSSCLAACMGFMGLFVIGVEFLGDAEGVHAVVVDVDERMVAVVHVANELTETLEVVVSTSVDVVVVDIA